MKKTETTPTFIIICIVILAAAYGIGLCIHEININRIKAAQNKALAKEIQNIESHPVYEGTAQEIIYTQNVRTGQANERINERINTIAGGRNNRMGTNSSMQNSRDTAIPQSRQRAQNTADVQRQQILRNGLGTVDMFSGSFEDFSDPEAENEPMFEDQGMFGEAYGFGFFDNPEAMDSPVFDDQGMLNAPQGYENPEEFFPMEDF